MRRGSPKFSQETASQLLPSRQISLRSVSGSRLVALSLAASLSLPFFGGIPRAFAEPTTAELTAARELFDQGLKLEEKKEWQAALDKFRKVAAVKATPQVRFHMGLCLENLGKLVDALNEFERALAEASADSSSSTQTVVKSSQKHIDELRERVPRVTIQVPEGAKDVAITIDGSSVSAAVIGTAIPLDPGSHTVHVTATNKTPFDKSFDLVEKGAPTIIDVVMSDAVTTTPTTTTDTATTNSTTTDVAPTSKGGAGALPWIIGGIGLVAFAGAGFMYAKRASTISELDDTCGADRSRCPQSKSDVADSGKTYTTVGNVLLGVGGAAVVTAVVLLIVAPSSSSTEPKSAAIKPGSISLGASPTPLGFGVQGAF